MSKVTAKEDQGVVSEREKDKVVVLDFGGQYSHLIVRRCRELGVYTELLSYDVPVEELRRGIERAEGKIRGIILSGSPFGVHEPCSPRCASEIVALDVPILGICYGAQLLADMLGGVVTTGGAGEFGRTELSFSSTDLFEGVSETGKTIVWMSHSDVIERFNGADVIGTAANSPVAAFRVRDKIYGVQFHPEVRHTEMGDKILWNFLYRICKCERNWEIASFIEDAITKI
ncbi:MAG: glutamine-hydrolyzing GMP synthase, partial [Methanocellales archaeon]|nr:glutamine-hydrolyzing GMP synthase [Methanocellales archaeon]